MIFMWQRGSMTVYRIGLAKTNEARELFLAVEQEIYNTFFQKSLIQETLQQGDIHLLIFDSNTQTILKWTH